MIFELRARWLFRRVRRLGERGDADGAIKTLWRLLESGHEAHGPVAGIMLGQRLLIRDRFAEAQAAYERILAYCGTPPRPIDRDPPKRNWPFKATVGLEVALELQGDHDGAARARELSREFLLEEARARGEDEVHPAEWELKRGGELKFRGQVAAARRAYERAVAAGHPRWSPYAADLLRTLPD